MENKDCDMNGSLTIGYCSLCEKIDQGELVSYVFICKLCFDDIASSSLDNLFCPTELVKRMYVRALYKFRMNHLQNGFQIRELGMSRFRWGIDETSLIRVKGGISFRFRKSPNEYANFPTITINYTNYNHSGDVYYSDRLQSYLPKIGSVVTLEIVMPYGQLKRSVPKLIITPESYKQADDLPTLSSIILEEPIKKDPDIDYWFPVCNEGTILIEAHTSLKVSNTDTNRKILLLYLDYPECETEIVIYQATRRWKYTCSPGISG